MASGSNLDRISSLPDNVIIKILNYLPVRAAVITSRLSRTWRYRWMFITELVFDQDSGIYGETKDQQTKFITNILLLHPGNITKFEIRQFLSPFPPDIGRWLFFLSRKKLSHLALRFHDRSNVLPSSLFYCEHLTTLELVWCGLRLPPRSQLTGFKNLISLDLVHVTTNKETIEFLVNTSPLLENLTIKQWNSVISSLNISSSNLRKCVIHGNFGSKITFVKTPKLRHTDINIWVHGKSVRCRLNGILGGLAKIQTAKFHHPFIKFLSLNNFLERLPITYYHLKDIYLEINSEDPKQILAALWLFRSSPSLKTIDILLSTIYPSVSVVYNAVELEEFYETLDERETVFQSLESFNLQSFRALPGNELRLIQFVLLNASVLQTMKINWLSNAAAQKAALHELVGFQRTSAGVKMTYLAGNKILGSQYG